MFKEKILLKDYSVTKVCNSYLVGSKIIDIFVLRNIDIEGGLTVIFERDKERGIVILGYSELGEWVEFLQVGNKKIIDCLGFEEVVDSLNQLIKEYQIA